ncbi:MAG: zinc-ribbon domain-containing protein, partial [Myxococcota bacterium]
MDVTCERCGTRYDFDEALVSARGTTVKCTNCGHQFKVYRVAGADDPDGWTVRTSDGRELNYRAMRELQAAIASGHVARRDTLVPRRGGTGRALGQIEELASFFAGSHSGPPPANEPEAPTIRTPRPPPSSGPVARASLGVGTSSSPPSRRHGDAANRHASRKGTLLGGTTAPVRPSSAQASSAQASSAQASSVGAAPASPPRIPGATSAAAAADDDITPPVIRGEDSSPHPQPSTAEPAAKNPSRPNMVPSLPAPAAPPTRGRKRPASPDAVASEGGLATTSVYDPDDDTSVMRRVPKAGPPAIPRSSAPPPPPRRPGPPGRDEPSRHGLAEAVAALETAVRDGIVDDDADDVLVGDDATLGDIEPDDELPIAVVSRPDGPRSAPSSPSADVSVGSLPPPLAHDADLSTRPASDPPATSPRGSRPPPSSAPLTPTPSLSRPGSGRRISEVFSDPRFSGYRDAKRAGVARWAVGVILLGVFAVGVATWLRRSAALKTSAAATSTPSAPAGADGAADTFLRDGRRHLDEGDVESAREAYVRASAVAASDPRVLRALARVAIVQADFDWLHLRLVAEGTPHHAAVRQALARRVVRATEAARAAAAAEDGNAGPATLAALVDAARLAGDVSAARQRVAQIDRSSPDGARALAALDLTEEQPNYPTVLDRLRTAVLAERKLGRARAMLVYALVRAGRTDEAEGELQTLRRQSPGHPLAALLQHLVDGTAPPSEAEPSGLASATSAPNEPTASAPPATPRRPSAPAAARPAPAAGAGGAEPVATGEPDLSDILPPASGPGSEKDIPPPAPTAAPPPA